MGGGTREVCEFSVGTAARGRRPSALSSKLLPLVAPTPCAPTLDYDSPAYNSARAIKRALSRNTSANGR